MEPCNVSAGANETSIILDPYQHAFTYPVKSISLYSMAGIAGLLAFLEWHLGRICPNGNTPRHLQRFHQWLYITYFALSGLGYLMEAIGTTAFSQRSGIILFMVSRFLATLSLAPFLILVNGVGEALWPSRIWRSLWILNSLFVLISLIWVLWMVIDHTDFALTTVAYLLACVHGYGAVIWAIGNYIFCHYRINCVAAMILTLSLVALAVMDISCGPAGHHECYVKCFTFPGGHYLLAFVPIFFAYTLLGMSHTDPPKELKWKEALDLLQILRPTDPPELPTQGEPNL